MKKSQNTRVAFAVMAVCMVLALVTIGGGASAMNERPFAPVVKPTPPAPVFDDKERVTELAQRRTRVAQTIGSKSLLVMLSTEPRVYANDVDYQFRQENNLFYLTNLNKKRSILGMMPGNPLTPEILFLPKRDPRAETWTGHMYSPQEAAQLSGIKEIWDVNEFTSFAKSVRAHEAFLPRAESIFMTERTGAVGNGG